MQLYNNKTKNMHIQIIYLVYIQTTYTLTNRSALVVPIQSEGVVEEGRVREHRGGEVVQHSPACYR